jgi:Class III cytochrome C family
MKKKASIILGLSMSIMLVGYLYAGRDPNALAASSEKGLPEVRVLGSISEKYEPVTFDHAKHVAIAGKCAACHHHGNGQTESCGQCHKLDPSVFKNSVVHNFLPCSSCHTKSNPDNPSMPALNVAYHQKCFACHRGMGSVGIDPKGCAEVCHAKKTEKASMNVPQ